MSININCVHELRSIEYVTPYHANIKKHPKKQIEKLASMICEYGFDQPIVIDGDGVIIKGHCRFEASKKLGMTEVPVIVRTDLSKAQVKAARIADNKIAESEWDIDNLVLELNELDDMEFNADLTGFDEDERDKLIPTRLEYEGNTDPDDIPEEVETRCKPGDLWVLGNHRLLCGDSTNVQHVERLMGGEKADCLFTDPPYNIAFKPQRGTHGTIANDDMDPESFMTFLRGAIACALIATKETCYAFVWSGWSTLDQFAPVLREAFTIKALPIWVKNNFGIGYYSRPKYEPFFLCLRGEPEKPATAPADVWEHAKVHDTVHSCEKPVGLIENILGAYVGRAIVLDLFLGSGSTLIACEKTGRKCYGMEIDPHYIDVAIERWEKFTGKKAVLLSV